ncbi:uncharacterized protein FFUJ_14176 [Fusarium fujikuroi IMI 58289]|uniref:Uncharacterized protein n=1 Tax=Gibberella fujikuroi (strain CBS 195.34 / IMI 58289 / NRRL A-6831) TaxID=1279085 RepID=S0EMY3_GIBF5|nr:uncharacterized protein FFUJ_14176 [Fusarium fujikuroi IMI 58289]CCT76191.1 uncharacterized protein FFUJ_14176 [Fusarium fujikuroi IMI 58289]SCO26787.1 uncharacterized protein FFM5_15056 [Fusarium fujikuroi]
MLRRPKYMPSSVMSRTTATHPKLRCKPAKDSIHLGTENPNIIEPDTPAGPARGACNSHRSYNNGLINPKRGHIARRRVDTPDNAFWTKLVVSLRKTEGSRTCQREPRPAHPYLRPASHQLKCLSQVAFRNCSRFMALRLCLSSSTRLMATHAWNCNAGATARPALY